MRAFKTNQCKVFDKSDTDVLDYTHRAEEFLNGDTIATSTWESDGVTIDSDTNDTTNATAIISGGVEGGRYFVKNTITTTAGLTKQAFFVLRIKRDQNRSTRY